MKTKVLIMRYLRMMISIVMIFAMLGASMYPMTREGSAIKAKVVSMASAFKDGRLEQANLIVNELLQKISEDKIFEILQGIDFLEQDMLKNFFAWVQERSMQQRAEIAVGRPLVPLPVLVRQPGLLEGVQVFEDYNPLGAATKASAVYERKGQSSLPGAGGTQQRTSPSLGIWGWAYTGLTNFVDRWAPSVAVATKDSAMPPKASTSGSVQLPQVVAKEPVPGRPVVPAGIPEQRPSVVATRLLFEDIQLLPQVVPAAERKLMSVKDRGRLESLSKRGAAAIDRRIAECLATLPKERNTVQAMVISRDSQVYVVGDLHASFNGILAQIQDMRILNFFKDGSSLELNDNCYLVFTGDFADRGTAGTEVLMLIMGLKTINPNNVFICRGNHETEMVGATYGFFNSKDPRIPLELPNRFSRVETVSWGRLAGGPTSTTSTAAKTDADMLQRRFNELFLQLPVAVFLGIKDDQGGVHFGMFNHACFDAQANPAILQVIGAAIGNPGQLQTAPIERFNDISSGFLWGDYIAGAGTICRPSQQRVFECTQGAFDAYANALQVAGAPHAFTIDFQARGHQHKDGGAFILDQSYAPGEAERPAFTPLQNNARVQINRKEVFMFMCVSESFNALANETFSAHDGFGQFMMNAQGHWELIPHVTDLATRDKLAAQIRAKFMLPLLP